MTEFVAPVSSQLAAAPVPRPAIAAGSPAFQRISRAMFFGGFTTFALLYCIQPLMPLLSREFALSAAHSSWSLSISTMTLATSLLLASAVSDRFGRKPLMVAALLVAAVMTLLCAFAQDYPQLLAMRAALGLALGGMPAIAMTYLGEEIDPPSLGLSMGLYIAGSGFGGMAGRLSASLLGDFVSWRAALALVGVCGILAAAEFWRSLPRSRNFVPGARGWSTLPAGLRQHRSDPGLTLLFCLGFLLMGCFVSMYNYIGYRLLAAPFGLRQGVVGAFAFLYLIGVASSVWAGRVADRLGRRRMLWRMTSVMLAGLLLTLPDSLFCIVVGMALFTFGFFASHSVASSWVSRRARAPQALAAALYLFFYYVGSSLIGSLSGVLWALSGWPGVVALLAAGVGLALLIGLRLRALAPVARRAHCAA